MKNSIKILLAIITLCIMCTISYPAHSITDDLPLPEKNLREEIRNYGLQEIHVDAVLNRLRKRWKEKKFFERKDITTEVVNHFLHFMVWMRDPNKLYLFFLPGTLSYAKASLVDPTNIYNLLQFITPDPQTGGFIITDPDISKQLKVMFENLRQTIEKDPIVKKLGFHAGSLFEKQLIQQVKEILKTTSLIFPADEEMIESAVLESIATSDTSPDQIEEREKTLAQKAVNILKRKSLVAYMWKTDAEKINELIKHIGKTGFAEAANFIRAAADELFEYKPAVKDDLKPYIIRKVIDFVFTLPTGTFDFKIPGTPLPPILKIFTRWLSANNFPKYELINMPTEEIADAFLKAWGLFISLSLYEGVYIPKQLLILAPDKEYLESADSAAEPRQRLIQFMLYEIYSRIEDGENPNSNIFLYRLARDCFKKAVKEEAVVFDGKINPTFFTSFTPTRSIGREIILHSLQNPDIPEIINILLKGLSVQSVLEEMEEDPMLRVAIEIIAQNGNTLLENLAKAIIAIKEMKIEINDTDKLYESIPKDLWRLIKTNYINPYELITVYKLYDASKRLFMRKALPVTLREERKPLRTLEEIQKEIRILIRPFNDDRFLALHLTEGSSQTLERKIIQKLKGTTGEKREATLSAAIILANLNWVTSDIGTDILEQNLASLENMSLEEAAKKLIEMPNHYERAINISLRDLMYGNKYSPSFPQTSKVRERLRYLAKKAVETARRIK